jgi:uncharacterized membrane protein
LNTLTSLRAARTQRFQHWRRVIFFHSNYSVVDISYMISIPMGDVMQPGKG